MAFGGGGGGSGGPLQWAVTSVLPGEGEGLALGPGVRHMPGRAPGAGGHLYRGFLSFFKVSLSGTGYQPSTRRGYSKKKGDQSVRQP